MVYEIAVQKTQHCRTCSFLYPLVINIPPQRHKANEKAEANAKAEDSKLGSCAVAVSRRLHSAVTASARMKQRTSEELGAIWAEIEAAEEERDTLAEMGEGGAGRLPLSELYNILLF